MTKFITTMWGIFVGIKSYHLLVNTFQVNTMNKRWAIVYVTIIALNVLLFQKVYQILDKLLGD